MTKETARILSETIQACFISPNVCDSNGEAANLVDVIQYAATGQHRIADALEKNDKSN